jgi:hypothetical protein
MISWKYKLWRTAGAVTALGLAACGGEGGENGGPKGEAGESGGAASAPVAAAGGEHGEAGVANAYAGVEGAQRTALRLQHLKGFVLVAERVAGDAPGDAAVLVAQGLLEVYDPAAEQFGGLDAAALRAAGAAGTPQNLRAATRALDAARPGDADYAALAVSMIDIATGLYQHVDQEGAIDPIEYQHSLGAALSARDALSAGRQTLRARNARAYDEAITEIERFVTLWPAATAPERPTPYRELLAQSSRVRLALSPLLF